jgi:hypothetical protein
VAPKGALFAETSEEHPCVPSRPLQAKAKDHPRDGSGLNRRSRSRKKARGHFRGLREKTTRRGGSGFPARPSPRPTHRHIFPFHSRNTRHIKRPAWKLGFLLCFRTSDKNSLSICQSKPRCKHTRVKDQATNTNFSGKYYLSLSRTYPGQRKLFLSANHHQLHQGIKLVHPSTRRATKNS